MSNKCLLCHKEAEIKVSFYEREEVKSFYVCKGCAEYVVYRFLYLDKEVEGVRLEREEEDE
jgi:protein-arginine kinase activator protein McsA